MSAILTAYQTCFRVGEWVAPDFTARKVASMFLTPLPRRKPAAWPPAIGSRGKRIPLSWGDEELEAWTFGEGGRRVLLCHGWGETASRLAGFVAPLLDAGFEVVAFDAPAHGRSRAKRTNLGECTEVLLEVQRRYGPFEGALGHSFGAASIIYGLHTGLELDRAVLVAPFSSSDGNFARFADVLRLGPNLRARSRERLLEFFADKIDGWNLAPVTGAFETDALLVHDVQDRVIPISESEAIASTWPGASLLATDGLGHTRILRDSNVSQRAADFIASGRQPRHETSAVG